MKPNFFPTERGQALIIISLAAIGLFAILGLAIDGSAKFSDRRHAQNAADSAVLAGALARIQPDSDWKLAALNRALENGYDGNHVTNEVDVFACDEDDVDCGPYTDNPLYIKVVITSHVNTYFARVIGINQTHNVVQATSISQEQSTGQLYGGASIVGLAPDECKTIWLSGSAAVKVNGGGIFSNSEKDCGVTIQGAKGFSITMDGRINMVAAGYTKNGNPNLGNIAGGLHGGADQFEYPPPASTLPNPVCTGSAAKSGNKMTPGNWSGTFPPSGVKTLDPGTYCIDGSFKLNSKDDLTGTGVTIYMKSGDIDWNGGAKVNLTAPTSGEFPGLLIYAPMSNTNTMRFNGTAGSDLTGTIYMPAASLVYNGTGNLNPSHVQIIGYTVEITGENATNVLYQNADNWDATIPAKVGLMQ
jgi:hypothetical protein